MEADYLIIGQGISGTLLSRCLLKEGRSVVVIDDGYPSSSSRVAGGIINPVTGKRLVRSWMADELIPYAGNTYGEFGRELNVPLVQDCTILDFHLTQEMSILFSDKLADEKDFLAEVEDGGRWESYFRFNYGIGEIRKCMMVDIRAMLDGWRRCLAGSGVLLEEKFDQQACIVAADHVSYKNIKAGKIIFCDGAACATNPYFEMLPWSKDKGETLIVSIPGLPRTHIYKQGISIVPWQEDLFWVGATHDWKFDDMNVTAAFRRRAEEQLGYWLKLPFTIVDHIVAQRPANLDRKPFIGLHPLHPSVAICNGMGGKGISMAPYFTHQLAQHLVHGTALMADVDISRFRRILSAR